MSGGNEGKRSSGAMIRIILMVLLAGGVFFGVRQYVINQEMQVIENEESAQRTDGLTAVDTTIPVEPVAAAEQTNTSAPEPVKPEDAAESANSTPEQPASATE